jgi:protein TonB
MNEQDEKRSKRAGLAGTLAVHGILLLFLILMKLIAPVPPPEQEGILINFGTSDQGTGDIQPTDITSSDANDQANDETLSEPEPASPEPVSERPVQTQDTDPAPVVNKTKPKNEPKPEKKPEPVKEPVKPPEPKPDPRALYPGKKNEGKGSSGSEGTTGQPGDQGSTAGDPNATSHSGSGKGDSGISFDLAGRSMLRKPSLQDNSQETGKIVVSIIVDKDGRVVSATGGARGTTIASKALWDKAEAAARKATFSKSPSGVEQQTGTITFIFKFE